MMQALHDIITSLSSHITESLSHSDVLLCSFCMYTQEHTRTRMHAHVHTQRRTHTRAHTHTHTHTHNTCLLFNSNTASPTRAPTHCG